MTKQWLYVIDEAIKRIENDELELGLQALKKVQEHGRELPEVMLYLAEVWYRFGHLNEAEQLLQDILRRNSDLEPSLRQECQLLLAEIALDGNDFDTAQTILYELVETGEENLRLDLLLTDLYAMQGLDEVAIKYLEQARKKDPKNKEILTALGNMYFQIGKDDEAMQALDEAGEQSVDLILSKARVLAQNGEFEQAYHLFQHALEQQQSAEIFYGCAMMAFHTGKLEEAQSFVGSLLALDEEYVAGYPLSADIYLSQGKTEKAIEALEQYVELSGFDLDQIRRLVALLTQAGRYDDVKTYQKLLDDWNTEEE
ncbi:tetratricopeptide repeat protein [Brevibacillus ruminantium]|uniref:Tetratricopeptide repeat protein n=1 Tax=Brevibacillus ruminantium TaxID=2950604 RepID=A0ABY4W9P8_9BACL|nr:tetratricopeptide repeat protein [Brevibacillus ruminantium]USG63494.1 tetratricopeptide repeat protein [Brevibacillus ruminantium]